MQMTENVQPLITPNPGKQTEFVQSTESRILYGGARGGGKSQGLAFKAAFQVRRWHYECEGKEYDTKKDIPKGKNNYELIIDKISIDYPDYVALLIRRTYPDIVKNLKIECDKLYHLYGAEWRERDHCYLFPSGAKIFLNHCQDEKALRSFIGGNYMFIGIDEANQFYSEWIEKIDTSLRTTNPELKAMLCLTSNPGDVGHHHLKETYVDRCPPVLSAYDTYNEEFDIKYNKKQTGKAYVDDEGIEYLFIPATVFDNPKILENDKVYVKKLKKLNPTLRAMWLNGDWDVVVGMFFDNWDINVHIIEEKKFRYGIDFDKENHTLYRFYDYGTKKPFVCLFAAVDSDSNMIIFDEIVETGLSAKRQAEVVNEYTLEKYRLSPEDFAEEIADPAYDIRGSEGDDLISPAEKYAEQGIFLTFANNDREGGAKVLYDALDVPVKDPRIPRIRVTDNCEYLCRTIPYIQCDSVNPEKYDTKGEDHAVDALRYGATRILDFENKISEKVGGWRKRVANMTNSFRYLGCSVKKAWMSQ